MANVYSGCSENNKKMIDFDYFRLNDEYSQVTKLGMGCWSAGGHGWGPVNDSDSIAAIRYAFDNGINFFDTADCYGLGKSESVLFKALGHNLKSVCVASKGGVRWDSSGKVWNDSSPEYLKYAVEASLQRLKLEKIPLYYLHKHDNLTPVADTIGALMSLREGGKIGEIGVANFSAKQLAAALEVASIKAVQVQYNLLYPGLGIELSALCQKHEVRLVAWGALADGLLTGKFNSNTTFTEDDHRSRMPAFSGINFINNLDCVDKLSEIARARGVTLSQLALRWVMDSYEWTSSLFGAKTAAQVRQNLGASGWQLTEKEKKLIDEYSAYRDRSDPVEHS